MSDHVQTGWRRDIGLTALLVGSALVVLGVFMAPAGAQAPPGNNGTVKVDGDDIESIPENDPHPGCTFTVEFRGYDLGNLTADVLFELQAPTRRLVGSQTVLEDKDIPIGGDAAGGANDLDASKAYTLDLTGVVPTTQGVHVRLTVNAEGSIGADVKHKVFWVSGCVLPTTTIVGLPTTTTSTTTSTTVPGATTTTGPATTSTTVSVLGTVVVPTSTSSTTTTTTTPPTTVGPSVLGRQFERPPSLPATGSSGWAYGLAVGLVLIVGGATLVPKDLRG